MAILSASDTAILQWVVDYLKRGGAGDGHLDQKVSDELARVFRSSCGFRCGCPGSFQDGLRDSPFSTLLRVFLCVADQSGIDPAARSRVVWVINYLEQGSAGSHHSAIDQKVSDELATVFRTACGYTCGCPGSFQEGLHESPIQTLVEVILCASAQAIGFGGSNDALNFFATCGFSVLAGTTVTNTGPSVLSGDLGLSPGTSVVGFPPGTVLGTQHVTDTQAAAAQLDLTAKYLDLEGRPGGTPVAGNIGGQTLSAGIYKSVGSLSVSSGELTLDGGGNANATFIFQIASTLTLTPGRQIILIGGAQAKNVFWQVGSSATLDTTSVFKGTIMALTSIAVNTGAQVEGRLLARNGAVTLQTNNVICPT